MVLQDRLFSNIKKKCSFDDVHSFLDDFRSGRPVEYDDKRTNKKILEATTNLNFSPRKYIKGKPEGPKRSTVQRILKKNNLNPYRCRRSSRVKDWHIKARFEWCKLMETRTIAVLGIVINK